MCIFDISREELGQLRLLADLDSRNFLPHAITRLNPACGGHAGGTLERTQERASHFQEAIIEREREAQTAR